MRQINKLIAIYGFFLLSAHLQAQTYIYDDLGRVKSVTTSASITTYNYDSTDNRASVIVNRFPTCSSPTNTVTGAIASVTINAATILGLCSDPGDTLTVTSPSLPLTYSLPAGQSRITNFTVSDGKGGTGSGSVTYTNSTANSAPSCGSPSNQVTGNPASVTINASDILALCTDVNGNSLTVTSPSVPYTFTLNPGAQKSVPYTVSDGNGGSGAGTITYTNTTVVNVPPTCNPGSKSVTGNPASVSIITSDITSLCSDANGDSLTVSSPSVPYNFSLAAGASQVVPFTVSDGHGGSTSNNLTVTNTTTPPVNRSPVCTSGSWTVTGTPSSVSIVLSDVLARCTDPDGDALTVMTPSLPYNFSLPAATSKTVPFTVSDGRGGSSSGNLTVTNTTANHPPVCTSGSKSVTGNPASVSVTSSDILPARCTDPDGDALTISSPSLPYNFSLAAAASQTVSFTVLDGRGGSSSNNLTVTNTTVVNTAPTCVSPSATMTGIPSYATASFTLTATGIISMCSDANGDALTVTSPAVPYTANIAAGQTIVTPFTVSDGKGGTGSGTFTMHRN